MFVVEVRWTTYSRGEAERNCHRQDSIQHISCIIADKFDIRFWLSDTDVSWQLESLAWTRTVFRQYGHHQKRNMDRKPTL